jgi:hypothetical protein
MFSRQHKYFASLVLLICAAAGANPPTVLVTTESGETIDKGLALAMETERRDAGFGDIVARGEIVNRIGEGRENRRSFEMVTVEVQDDGDRRFVRVDAPASMKGTMFLSHAHALEADDVWVLLPRSSRMRRVSAQDKTGRFLNSELTLEDISPWQVEKYAYRYLGEEDCDPHGEAQCFLVENTPRYQHSGYSRQLEWLDKEMYQPRRIEYYDQADRLVKVLEFSKYALFGGKHWRPMYMKMTNVQSRAESEIFWRDYRVGSGYSPVDLAPANLLRLRR